jgi:predicted neuraminidase
VEVYIRTHYGIGKSVSNDGGFTWSEVVDTGWFSPDTRFWITRLSSGNVLLISHQQGSDPKEPKLRTNLTAFLSDDNGKTWKGKLLLDERAFVSYPDGQEHGGYIYVTYDRDRRGVGEVLLAKFTEEDILNGEQVSPNGYLKKTVIKLKNKE